MPSPEILTIHQSPSVRRAYLDGLARTYYDRLKGQVVIITGASYAWGPHTAKLMAKEGGSIVLADTDLDAGTRLQSEIAEAGGEAVLVEADVSQEGHVEALVAQTVARYGRLDCLVNIASSYPNPADATGTAVEDWDTTIDVCLKGSYLTTKHAVPAMAAVGGGSIVNVSSIYATTGARGWVAFSAAKAGVIGLTIASAVDYGRFNIRVNCITPDGINDGIETDAIVDDGSPHRALRRKASAFEFASVAMFLAGKESSYITGAVIPVDGGETALLTDEVRKELWDAPASGRETTP
jgi:NAD(P)-dependent dehydrogenase (short-subunit alcohol dehydrogenase family)